MNISPARVWRDRVPRYRLVGAQCRRCGRRHYPPKPVCPYCGSRELEPVELPRTGVLESYTVVYQTGEGERERTPVYVGLVRLDDGTRVVAQLTDVAQGGLKTGVRVEAVFRRVRADGSYGLIAYGVKFRPVLGAVGRGGEGGAEREA